MSKPVTSVSHSHLDRQWDMRINVPTEEYLTAIVENAALLSAEGKTKYILVSGVEVGTRPYQTDYQVRHVHLCLIFPNPTSKASILKKLDVIEGHGYYLVPRNREFPYSGWREHHIKPFSKVDPSKPILFEGGELPPDVRRAMTVRSDLEKKRKLDEILVDMRAMYQEGKDEEIFIKYPRNTLIYGARLKAMVEQKRNFHGLKNFPNIWLHGPPGVGKSSLFEWLFEGEMYNKDLSNRFWDLYDDKIHKFARLEDVDCENVDRLGIQWFKTICDEGGFAIDQKYKTPQLTRATILVTSNYTIDGIMPEDTKDLETAKKALYRRFYHINVWEMHRLLGVKLLDNYDVMRLKKAGNTDASKLYMCYDYATGMPTGLPLKSKEAYRQMILDAYYGV